jgi:hypothetical protein
MTSRDAVCCKAVRSGARLIRDTTQRQPSRGEHDSRAPVQRRLPALPWRSRTSSRSATMSTTQCLSAVAPALQAAPSLLASVDSQIARRQRVSPTTMARDMLSPDFAAIDIGTVDDRRTITTNRARNVRMQAAGYAAKTGHTQDRNAYPLPAVRRKPASVR